MSKTNKYYDKNQLSFEFGPYPEKAKDDPYNIEEKKNLLKTQDHVNLTQSEYENYYREHGKRILDFSDEKPQPRKEKLRPFDIMNNKLYKGKKRAKSAEKTQTTKPVIRKEIKPKEEIDLLYIIQRNLESFAAPDKIEELKSIEDYLLSSVAYNNVRNIDDELLEGNPVYLDYKSLINYLSDKDRKLLSEFIESLLINFQDENDVKGISDFNNYDDD